MKILKTFGQRMIHRRFGGNLYRCTDGDDALFLTEEYWSHDSALAPRPTNYLLDLNLPGTDGREVAGRLER